jgi:hypothetical protein
MPFGVPRNTLLFVEEGVKIFADRGAQWTALEGKPKECVY